MLNVDVGAGHRRAAEALGEAIEAERPGSVFELVEALDYLGPGAKEVARELYLGVQRTIPDLWGMLYEQRPLFDLLRPLGQLVDEFRSMDLLPLARSFRPDVVIATHPVACGLGAALRRSEDIRAPLAAVVTDFDGHPAWVVEGVDLYLVASEAIARELAGHGAPDGVVAATGIPLSLSFAREPRTISEARQQLQLEGGRLTVLLLGGGLGLGPVLEAARRLTTLAGPVQLVIVAGSNRELEREARELAARSPLPIHVTGYVDNIADYIAASEIAISKPGGMTCAELMAVGVPLIALKPLAGQEEANCARLVQAGSAVRADTAEEAHDLLLRLLHEPNRLAQMRLDALRLGKPAAARNGARKILEMIGRRSG
jgi:processive 1,2-diacylglycerol beta-glucosyltransferase